MSKGTTMPRRQCDRKKGSVGGRGGSPEGDRSGHPRRGGGGRSALDSAGVSPASQRSRCGCCAGSRWRRCRGSWGWSGYRLEQWRDRAFDGIDAALRERAGDPVQVELDQAMKRIGELSMENELLRERCRAKFPLALGRPWR